MAATSTGLTGNTNIEINIAHKKELDLDTVLDQLNITCGVNWSWGISANQVDMVYHAELTREDDTAVIDISGTDIQDAFGDNADFAALKFLYIKNTDATEKLLLGADANHIGIFATLATDVLEIAPGGFFLWCDPSAAGLDVTTNKNLAILAETTEITCDIVLMGLAT